MRTVAILLAASALAAGAAACGEENRSVPPEAVGLISDVTGDGNTIESFTLETDDQGTLEVFIAEDVDYGFPLGHLREHQASRAPVRCVLEDRDGRAYALEIVDV